MGVVTGGRIGDFMETFTGRAFYPADPRPEDFDIRDAARALSLQHRYSGHTRFGWSVAAHSYWVAALCPPEAKLYGLIHDLPEAYCVDLPRPIKRMPGFQAYREIEGGIWRSACEWLGIDPEIPDVVDRADKAMLWWEANALMSKPLAPWWDEWRPYAESFGDAVEVRVQPTSPAATESSFLAIFHHLTEGRFM